MPIVQQATGVFDGATFTPTLPSASSASNCVVLCIAGNTTITTPTNWSLRTSQVNQMGHYWLERSGVSVTSVAVTNVSGQGVWYMAEIQGGVYDASAGALSANATAAATTYNTPTLTPTAGTRIVLASLGSVIATFVQRTLSGWTNSFVELADTCQPVNDYPMQGIAALDSLTASGSTGYSTTGTYSASSTGRTAIIASYVTTGGAAAAPNPRPTTVYRTAVHRSSNY